MYTSSVYSFALFFCSEIMRTWFNEYLINNYKLNFKAAIIIAGVILTGWIQLVPILNKTELESKTAQYTIEEKLNIPRIQDVNCNKLVNYKAECNITKYKIKHHEELVDINLTGLTVMLVLGIILILCSISGYGQNYKKEKEVKRIKIIIS